MKTIKIIDLLNKIANGEAPRKINYGGATYLYNLLCNDYEDINTGDLLFEDRFDANKILNDEVEILDEEDEFEDIEEIENKCERNKALTEDESKENIVRNFNMLANKINQLIKNQKKIIERLKDE